MIYGLVVFCLFSGALAVPTNSPCPTFTPVPNFNLTKFMGSWYESESSQRSPFECISIDLFNRSGVVVITHEHQQIGTNIEPIGGSQNSNRTPQVSHGGPAFTTSKTLHVATIHQRVLATDYTTFAVLWFCDVFKPGHIQILTRIRNPPIQHLRKAYRALEEKNLGIYSLFKTSQFDC